jgi:hypothetical protein
MMSKKAAMASVYVLTQHSSFSYQKYGVEYVIFITGYNYFVCLLIDN